MATRFLKVGAEVQLQTRDVAPPNRVRVRHGIVTAVVSQDSIMARIGRGAPIAATRMEGHGNRFITYVPL